MQRCIVHLTVWVKFGECFASQSHHIWTFWAYKFHPLNVICTDFSHGRSHDPAFAAGHAEIEELWT